MASIWRIIFFAPPPCIIFIIFCICWNCFSSWLTSTIFTPAPLAMRWRRLPLRMSGLRRSCFVIEWMIASVRAICFSALGPTSTPLMPGIMPTMLCIEPIFFTCCIWERKSSRLKSALRSFSAMRSASFWSMVSCAFSTSDTTSPMPRMREARRSG